MRLFQRTLLSFIGIILLQGVFTIFFVGYRIRKDQTQEIWRELGDESHKVFDNLNAWKRLLWKNTIELQESSALQSMLAREYTISLSSELELF
jgi:thiosulfate reductase cytochrome b subunit